MLTIQEQEDNANIFSTFQIQLFLCLRDFEDQKISWLN